MPPLPTVDSGDVPRTLDGPGIFTPYSVEGPFMTWLGNGNLSEGFSEFGWFGGGGSWLADFFGLLGLLWNIYSILAILLSLIFLFGFIYAKIRYGQLVALEAGQLRDAEAAWAHVYGGVQTENSRWDDIMSHIASNNPNDWRLAIIEADILLEETLDQAGFVGMTVSDRLKSASGTTFVTIQDAWTAHKVRNEIAHRGTDFVLTKRMAEDTIMQYERVFREFGSI